MTVPECENGGTEMNVKTCPREGCDANVHIKEATEMSTLINETSGIKTVFDVVFCSSGHIVDYRGKQICLPSADESGVTHEL